MVKAQRKLKKKRSWDSSGGLEGLPLQLIIMVVIAGIGISIVVAWLTVFSEKPLKALETTSITPGHDPLKDGTKYTIKIKAVNTDNKPMSGVTVTLEGPGVSRIATTGSDGIATFSNVTPDLPTNEGFGIISVTGNYKSWTIVGPNIPIGT